jgi:UDP-N-acetylmuramoyl-L-alanyl-D-glutamate--2,6-diaminopimelate ligase
MLLRAYRTLDCKHNSKLYQPGMSSIKTLIRPFIPVSALQRYHRSLAKLGALRYGHPSRSILTIGITGTKGKTSTTEMANAVFEAAGYRTALLNSIRMKVGKDSMRNPAGRSMPGRFFIQRFLAQALRAGCTVAIIEMTSEGAKQHRHRDIDLDAFVFLNLSPEHIESHGSLEAYANAKHELGLQLSRSSKRPRIIIANADDPQSARYLSLPVERSIPFKLDAHMPISKENGGSFDFHGTRITTPLPGEFSLKNALAAAELGNAFGITPETIAEGIAGLTRIPGRAERVDLGQDFLVVVDYAHTPDSLKALLKAYQGRRKICILGSAGGGRDAWKRPVLGKTAEENADVVILTNDDPYDEDPQKILREIQGGMKKESVVLPDRREAIRAGLRAARHGDAVLITGKGIDPIYGPGGVKIPWNDVEVAQQELRAFLDENDIMKQ